MIISRRRRRLIRVAHRAAFGLLRISNLEEATKHRSNYITALIDLTNAICDWVHVATDEMDKAIATRGALQKVQKELRELREDVHFLMNVKKDKPPNPPETTTIVQRHLDRAATK